MGVADSLKRETGRAIRSLARSPGFTLIVIITLSLGIGATTAIFTMLDRVVLHALPYADSDRLVWLDSPTPGIKADERWAVSVAGYFYFKRNARTLQSVGVLLPTHITITGKQAAERVPAVLASGSLFDVLKLRPMLGRVIEESDNLPHAAPVAVVGYNYWKTRLNSDPGVIGSTMIIGTAPHQIVGVMGPDAGIPDAASSNVDLWLPAQLDPGAQAQNSHYLNVVARLAPGTTAASSQAELAQFTKRFPELFPTAYSDDFMRSTGFTTAVTPLRTFIVGDIAKRLWILLASVALVLVIACGNVANLLLVRAEGRQREVAIRTALGAKRRDLAWHYLTESMLLALISGAAAFAIAAIGLRIIVALAPPGIPRMSEVHLGWVGALFTIAVSVGVGFLFGGLALAAGEPAAGAMMLSEGGRGMTASKRQNFTRGVLVAAQTALALVLLTAAGLLLQSFRNLRNVSPGFNPTNVLTAEVNLPYARYDSFDKVETFYHELMTRAAAIPGVQVASASDAIPLAGGGFKGCSSVFIENPSGARGKEQGCVATTIAAPGFFSALGIKLRGSDPTWSDVEQRTGGVVVTKALANRLWPGQDPMGKGIKGLGSEPPFYRVVGVTEDFRGTSLDGAPAQAAFFPMLPMPKTHLWRPPNDFTLTLRTNGVPPETLISSLRRTLTSMDPDVPLGNVSTMEAVVAQSMVRLSFTMTLLAISAGMALILSAIGIYGVISYIVGKRRGEIGIRMALGAHASRVGALVVLQSVQFTIVGIVIGIAGTLLATRVLSSVLFGVSPNDPMTLLVVSTIMVLIAVLASYVPAQRAMKVDPVEALRAD